MGVLRLILALAVVAAHTGGVCGFNLLDAKGILAVQSFFMISGFYMALILNEKYTGRGSYKLFLSNRFLRLYPVYWTVLIVVLFYSLFIPILSPNGFSSNSIQMYRDHHLSISSYIFLIFTNIFILCQDVVMFLGLDRHSGNLFFTSNFQSLNPQLWKFLLIPPAWSLGLELTFYFIAPFLVRRNTRIIIGVILMTLFVRLLLIHHGYTNDPWIYRFFPTELGSFMLGVLAYKIYIKLKDKNIKQIYFVLIFIMILVITILYHPIYFSHTIMKRIGMHEIYLFLFFLSIPFIFILTKRSKYDRMIGELSFPIYICHFFVLECVERVQSKLPFHDKGVLTITFAIIFAIILNRFVAKPIEVLRKKRVQKNLINKVES